MLYQVENSDVVLCGSFHFLPKDYILPSAYVERAGLSGICYFEDSLERPQDKARYLLPSGDFLARRLPPKTYNQVRDLCSELGIENISRLKVWRVEQVITVALIGRAENSGGVDHKIWDVAKASNKHRRTLETLDLADTFGNTSIREQVARLKYLVEDPVRPVAQYQRMLEGWINGDSEAIRAEMAKDAARAPEVNKVVFTDRDAQWYPQVVSAIRSNENAFFCFGVGHLVGPRGIAERLEADGYSLKSIR